MKDKLRTRDVPEDGQNNSHVQWVGPEKGSYRRGVQERRQISGKAGHPLGTLHLSRQELLFRGICRLLTLQHYPTACGRNPGSQDTGPAAKHSRLHGKTRS